MKGYQLTLYTQQNRRHQGKMLADWIVGLAMDMGLRGATLVSEIEGEKMALGHKTSCVAKIFSL